LAPEKRRAQERMHAPGRIEQRRISSLEQHWQHARAGRARQAAERVVPFTLDVPRDLTRWKHDERAALAEPEMRRTQAGPAAGCRIGPTEGIDEEARPAKLRDAREQAIGEHAYVGPRAPHQLRHHEPVERAGRMSGGDDERALLRD